MREAIGNSFIVNLLLVFLGVMSIIFIGSISYSKAFKVKNRIIYIIEKYGEWPESSLMNQPREEIEASLKQIGYPLVARIGDCSRYLKRGNAIDDDGDTEGLIVYGANAADTSYHYCVYKFENNRGVYYGVVTFMHFEIPLLAGILEFPVYGETKTLYSTAVHYHN